MSIDNKVVLLVGLPNDPGIVAVTKALKLLNIDYLLWNQRNILNDISVSISNGIINGVVIIDDQCFELDSVCGVYNRLSDLELVPEIIEIGFEHPIAKNALNANWNLSTWFEIADIPILNKSTANESNSTKGYQLQLIRDFFTVPETLISNDYNEVLNFWQNQGKIIYKSCSGERSIVTYLDEETFSNRKNALGFCPVMFQQFIDGQDIRVHVVGNETHSTLINSNATDYRYDNESKWEKIDLPLEYQEVCIKLSRFLDLELSGIDLRFNSEGIPFCFEVNTSPAFTAYEEVTGQEISKSIANYLGSYR